MIKKIINPFTILSAIIIHRLIIKYLVLLLNTYILNPKILIDLFHEGVIVGVGSVFVIIYVHHWLTQKK